MIFIFFQIINLKDSVIDTIEYGTFHGMESLSVLDLSVNLLSVMPPLHDVRDTLKSLFLKLNKISEIPNGYFNEFVSLTTLDMTENKLKVFTNDIMAALQSMGKVSFQSNHITSVECGSFRRLSKVTEINFSNNRLNTFPCLYPLHPDSCVSNLLLDNNQISEATENNVANLTCLRSLRISSNQIRNGSFIKAIPSLIEVYMTGNEMAHLLNDSCTAPQQHSFSSLIKGRFENNDLTEFPCVPGMPDGSQLSLANNRISVFPRERIAVLNNVSELFLQNNQAKIFPDFSTLADRNQLKALALQWNKISSIPWNFVRNLHNLEILHLHGNDLISLPDMTFAVQTLLTFNIHDNHLLNVDPVVASNAGHWLMTSWDISNNNISHVKNELLSQMSSLQILTANNNRMTMLPYLTAVRKTLVKAYFQQNIIAHVPTDHLKSMTVLQELDLSNNLLTSFPFEIIGVTFNLRTLYLQNNHISTIPYLSYLPPMPDLTVDVHDNHLNCTRKLCWMRHFHQFNLLRETYLCEGQPVLSEYIFNELTDDQLECYCK